MPTAACGINCDVCKLNLLGTCSTCGPGTSLEAEKKLAAQSRLLGSPCPILACANLNRVQFCLRDCSQFPCENFTHGPYPFSEGYIAMQKRRRKEIPPASAPDNTRVSVDPNYWDELQKKEILGPGRCGAFDWARGLHSGQDRRRSPCSCLPRYREERHGNGGGFLHVGRV